MKLEITGKDIEVSGGYHTLTELYDHRITLWIALCKQIESDPRYLHDDKDGYEVWRSLFHSDGTSLEGWFVLGLGLAKGQQITYHLPIERWHQTNFATTLERAPEFDRHTSKDVLERLRQL